MVDTFEPVAEIAARFDGDGHEREAGPFLRTFTSDRIQGWSAIFCAFAATPAIVLAEQFRPIVADARDEFVEAELNRLGDSVVLPGGFPSEPFSHQLRFATFRVGPFHAASEDDHQGYVVAGPQDRSQAPRCPFWRTSSYYLREFSTAARSTRAASRCLGQTHRRIRAAVRLHRSPPSTRG